MSAPAGGAYDPVTRRLHWANAILALITIMLAWCLVGAPRHDPVRVWLLVLHGSFGIAILAVMLLWAGWRLRHTAPPLRPMLCWFEVIVAYVTQGAMFLLFIAMPITGYLSLAAAGKPMSLFGIATIPPLVPESGSLSQAAIALHLLGEILIYGLVALHMSAALMHGFIRRDGILERMLGRSSP